MPNWIEPSIITNFSTAPTRSRTQHSVAPGAFVFAVIDKFMFTTVGDSIKCC